MDELARATVDMVSEYIGRELTPEIVQEMLDRAALLREEFEIDQPLENKCRG